MKTLNPHIMLAAFCMAAGFPSTPARAQSPPGYPASAPAGRYDYIINGHFIGGFALIAWPAEYGKTGVMTFIVNHYGDVYESDIGPETAKIASAITEYNPTDDWSPAGD